MRVLALISIFLCILLCSCHRDSKLHLGGGEDTSWISAGETERVAEHFLTNRYPGARFDSLLANGATWRYRFSTNGTTLPVAVLVVVDRKTGKARFENVGR
jgi:hypothetical protein